MIPLQTASPHPVTHVRFSPDGATVAVAQPHYGVTVLERATGRTIATCVMPRRGPLTGLTFCGGGKYLAAANSKGLEVFEAETGAPVVRDYGVSFKGMRLAERDGAVIGFGLHTGGPVWRPEKSAEIADAFHPLMNVFRPTFTFSPDGRFMIEPHYREATLNDVDRGRYVAVLNRPDKNDWEAVVASAFCPLGRRFALNDGYTIDVFEFSREEADKPEGDSPEGVAVAPMPHVRLEPVFTLKPDSAAGQSRGWYPPFALAADGRGLLVKRPRNRIQLWDAPTGNLLNEWSWRFEWVTCVAVSADNLTAVAGGRHGRVLIWDLE